MKENLKDYIFYIKYEIKRDFDKKRVISII